MYGKSWNPNESKQTSNGKGVNSAIRYILSGTPKKNNDPIRDIKGERERTIGRIAYKNIA